MSVKKVFICGNQMSGKNSLCKLLDGHNRIICNHIHDRIGTSILSRSAKRFLTSPWSQNKLSFKINVPTVKVVYRSGQEGLLDYADLAYIISSFSNFRKLHRCILGGAVQINTSEGSVGSFPFDFDVMKFQLFIQNQLSEMSKTVHVEDIVDVIYNAYAISWNSNTCGTDLDNSDTYMVNMLSNGTQPIMEILEELPNARLLVMDRSIPDLLFANARRIAFKAGWTGEINQYFKRVLLSQTGYIERLYQYKKAIRQLEKDYENVCVVEFEQMTLNTQETMKAVADFLGIKFQHSLSVPSIGGKVLDPIEYPVVGKINDSAKIGLSEKDCSLLMTYAESMGSGSTSLRKYAVLSRIKLIKTIWALYRCFGLEAER